MSGNITAMDDKKTEDELFNAECELLAQIRGYPNVTRGPKVKDADHYIRVFCGYFDTQQVNNELAMMAPHLNGLLMDFEGEIPGGSGFMFDTVSPRVSRMKFVHKDYPTAERLIYQLPEPLRLAAVVWQFYMHRRPDPKNLDCKVLHSGKDIAEYFKLNYKRFNEARNIARDRINAELGILTA